MAQRNRIQKVRRVYFSHKKALLFVAIIVAVGIFMLFMHSVFKPLETAQTEQHNVAVQPEKTPTVSASSEKKADEGTETRVPPSVTRSTDTISSGEKSPKAEKKDIPVPPVQTEQKNTSNVSKNATNGVLIFVIDDAGNNMSHVEPFLRLPFPVSVAVLPQLAYSVQAADKIRQAGKEVLLHQPMQAQNRELNPGPGAIREHMSPEEISVILKQNVEELGVIAGINNHEGSLITADAQAMGAVLEFCREKNLYFLDSRTTAQSQAAAEAKRRSMDVWERVVFLDNSQDRKIIEDSVYEGMKIASKRGVAIMIGHVWSVELAQILTDMYPEMIEQGYSLSTISKYALAGDDK